MSFLGKLSDFFESIEHGPFMPAPDVQEKLESQGYSFKEVFVAAVIPATSNQIHNANGEEIGTKFFKTDEATKQYYTDYERAVQDCKTPKANP